MKNITPDDIASALCLYIKENIVDKNLVVDVNTPFNKIGIDSLSVIELVLFIERKFNVVIPEEELAPENFKSAETLAHCTHRLLSNE